MDIYVLKSIKCFKVLNLWHEVVINISQLCVNYTINKGDVKMTMYKSIYLTLMLTFFVCFFLPNCSDESPDEETLIGTWVLTKMRIDFGPYELEVDPAEIGLAITLTIREDNSFTIVTTEEGETTTSHGTWATSGNRLFVTEEGETEELEYSLNGDKLEISFEETEEGITVTQIQEFTRQ